MSRPLEELVSALAGKRILVLGDVILDEYIWGEVRRVSPEAPVPVVEVRRRTSVLGGAGNVAANVLALGGRAWLGGVIGPDAAGESLSEIVGRQGIDSSGLVRDPERLTTTKTRVVAHNQQVVRLDVEQVRPLPAAVEEDLVAWVDRWITQADGCVVSDYEKGVVTERLAQHLIGRARALGTQIIVDPKGRDYGRYRGATVVKPNVHELEQFCRYPSDDEARLKRAIQELSAVLPGSALVITRGEQGMCIYGEGDEAIHIRSMARQVFDVTGAGDTVTSVLALGLAAGWSIIEAAQMANLAAGIVVGKVGTATVTVQELKQAAELLTAAQ